MAKKRYINTKFWSDNYISGLDIIERYLFLYFLTNEHTNIGGIYELPMRLMTVETGLDQDHLEKILPRFAGKIYYINGWVYIKNFSKHQAVNTSVQEGIKRSYEEVPTEIMSIISNIKSPPTQPVDSLPPSSYIPNLTLLNSTLLNLTEKIPPSAPTPKDETKKFFNMVEEGSNEFMIWLESLCRETGISSEIAQREIKKFTSYWTELNSTGKKERWEMQKTFEVKKRLANWFSRAGHWYKQTTNKYQPSKV